jgi:hypothetical protein
MRIALARFCARSSEIAAFELGDAQTCAALSWSPPRVDDASWQPRGSRWAVTAITIVSIFSKANEFGRGEIMVNKGLTAKCLNDLP